MGRDRQTNRETPLNISRRSFTTMRRGLTERVCYGTFTDSRPTILRHSRQDVGDELRARAEKREAAFAEVVKRGPLLHCFNPVFGEMTIASHDKATIEHRRRDDEAVGRVFVDLRKRRRPQHDRIVEGNLLHAVLLDEHVGELAGRDGNLQLALLHLAGNLPDRDRRKAENVRVLDRLTRRRRELLVAGREPDERTRI